jgi:hypothetical protein
VHIHKGLIDVAGSARYLPTKGRLNWIDVASTAGYIDTPMVIRVHLPPPSSHAPHLAVREKMVVEMRCVSARE